MSNIDAAKKAIANVRVRPMSNQVAEVRQNINLIQEAMKATMKKDVHYGTIPGCGKPSLYKPGAEVIIALFKLSTDPVVNDLSKDGEIRYQVKVNITHRDGTFIGSGIGECSSGEEKYMWRAALCQEEFESVQEISRRIKFRKNNYKGTIEQVQQIRVNPSDMANTILKMAKKRALIDAVLTATGASDIFSQDLEDLPEGYIPPEANTQESVVTTPKPEIPETTNKYILQWDEDTQTPPQAPAQSQPPTAQSGDLISEPQSKRFYAIARSAGIDEVRGWLLENFGLESSKDIRKADYEKICKKAQEHKK